MYNPDGSVYIVSSGEILYNPDGSAYIVSSGEILYNPDGSAYILEEGELINQVPRQEGSFVQSSGSNLSQVENFQMILH